MHDDDIRSLASETSEIVRPTDAKESEPIVVLDEASSSFKRKGIMIDYRDLYEESQKRIQDKDRVIQDLSYRIGLAESELKHSISLSEYKKTTFLLESAKVKTEEEKKTLTETVK